MHVFSTPKYFCQKALRVYRLQSPLCASHSWLRVFPLPIVFVALLLNGCATQYVKKMEAQMEQLCAQDGVIRLYETVPLSPGKRIYTTVSRQSANMSTGRFRVQSYRMVNPDVFNPALGSAALGPEYIWEHSAVAIQRKEPGSPKVWREHYGIARRADRKILGELISYQRDHDGRILPLNQLFFGGTYVNGCPEGLDAGSLISAVFVETVKPEK